MNTSPVPPRPETRVAELLSELEALAPGIPVPGLLDLRDGLARVDGVVLRLVLTPLVTTMTPAEHPDSALTLEEAAVYLRRSKSWLYHRWRSLRLGYRDGGRLRFRQRDLERYLNAQRRGL